MLIPFCLFDPSLIGLGLVGAMFSAAHALCAGTDRCRQLCALLKYRTCRLAAEHLMRALGS